MTEKTNKINYLKIVIWILVILNILDFYFSYRRVPIESNPLATSVLAMVILKAFAFLFLFLTYKALSNNKIGEKARFIASSFLIYFIIVLIIAIYMQLQIPEEEYRQFEEYVEELKANENYEVLDQIETEKTRQFISFGVSLYLFPLIFSFISFLLFLHTRKRYGGNIKDEERKNN